MSADCSQIVQEKTIILECVYIEREEGKKEQVG